MKSILTVLVSLSFAHQAHAVFMMCKNGESNSTIRVIRAENCATGLAATISEQADSFCLSHQSQVLDQLRRGLDQGTAPQAYQACVKMTDSGLEVNSAIDFRFQ